MSAVAVSVLVMIIAVAIVKGYQREVKQKVVGFHAPIQITHLDLNNSYESYPVMRDITMERLVRNVNGVGFIQRYATKAGILKTDSAFEGIVLKGVDDSYDWQFFYKHLVRGHLPQYKHHEEPANELLISLETARLMQLDTGMTVLIYFVQEPPRVRKLKICGVFDTGLGDLDKLYAFTDIRMVQKLNQWDSSYISGYEIGLEDLEKTEIIREQLVPMVPYNMGLGTIFELYPSLFDWLALLDLNVVIILVLMTAVASINMITALLILILERLSMVGLFKAMGSTNRQVSSIFLYMAARIIGKGLFIGNIVGLGLAVLQKKTGLVRLDPNAYYLNKVPILVVPQDLIWINLLAFVVCMLMLFLPLRLVSNISPAKTIRFN